MKVGLEPVRGAPWRCCVASRCSGRRHEPRHAEIRARMDMVTVDPGSPRLIYSTAWGWNCPGRKRRRCYSSATNAILFLCLPFIVIAGTYKAGRRSSVRVR